MSSHQDPYYYYDTSPNFYGTGSEPSVAHQLHHPQQSWPATATTGDQSGYSQPHQSTDPVGNLLEAHDAEDMYYSFNHPPPNYSLPSTSFQDPGIGTEATYINDNTPSHSHANLPFSHYLEIDSRHSQNHYGYAPYEPVHDHPNQPFVHGAHQMSGDLAGSFGVHPVQNIHTSQVPSASVYPSPSSTQLPSLGRGGPVYQTDSTIARPIPDSLTQDAVDTGRTELPNADTRQYSHPSYVATSLSNQTSAPGPSRPLPSSPERRRLMPSSADGERSTARRMVPRHDRARGVHPTSSGSHGRSRSNSYVYGRGPLIPQERYTTSSISSYSTPDQHPPITFDLENPHQTGISIVDVLNKTDSFARIWGGTQAFSHMGKKTFTLRVQWPGYKPWSKTIAAMDWTKTRAPITRVKLAEAVAIAVRDLIEKYRNESYDPDYAEWNLGPNGIQLDQLCLVAVHHVSRGSWQPKLCLLEPRH